jgi:hypothetical protein
MLPSWSQCSKCNSTVENPSSAVQTLLKGFLFVIKCPKCNQLFPSKKYSIFMGICFLFMLYILINPNSSNRSSRSTNVCDDVVEAMSGFMEMANTPTAPNANINALRNGHDQAKRYSRSFNDDPTMYIKLCSDILTESSRALWPRR